MIRLCAEPYRIVSEEKGLPHSPIASDLRAMAIWSDLGLVFLWSGSCIYAVIQGHPLVARLVAGSRSAPAEDHPPLRCKLTAARFGPPASENTFGFVFAGAYDALLLVQGGHIRRIGPLSNARDNPRSPSISEKRWSALNREELLWVTSCAIPWGHHERILAVSAAPHANCSTIAVAFASDILIGTLTADASEQQAFSVSRSISNRAIGVPRCVSVFSDSSVVVVAESGHVNIVSTVNSQTTVRPLDAPRAFSCVVDDDLACYVFTAEEPRAVLRLSAADMDAGKAWEPWSPERGPSEGRCSLSVLGAGNIYILTPGQSVDLVVHSAALADFICILRAILEAGAIGDGRRDDNYKEQVRRATFANAAAKWQAPVLDHAGQERM